MTGRSLLACVRMIKVTSIVIVKYRGSEDVFKWTYPFISNPSKSFQRIFWWNFEQLPKVTNSFMFRFIENSWCHLSLLIVLSIFSPIIIKMYMNNVNIKNIFPIINVNWCNQVYQFPPKYITWNKSVNFGRFSTKNRMSCAIIFLVNIYYVLLSNEF